MGVRISTFTNGKFSTFGTNKSAYSTFDGWYLRKQFVEQHKFYGPKGYTILYKEGLGDWE